VDGELTPEVVAWKTAQRIATTEFVPQSYRGRPEAVFAAILYGRELGMGPMGSLQALNVIKGKPTLAPEAMRARVFAAGHRIDVLTNSDTAVVLRGRRSDGGEATVEWTLEDARRAGLAGGESWKRYPRAMLVARATSELCRMLFPDVISGASYTPEELGDDEPTDVAEPVGALGSDPFVPEPLPALENADEPDDAEVVDEDADPDAPF
jgi:hypothetical protein